MEALVLSHCFWYFYGSVNSVCWLHWYKVKCTFFIACAMYFTTGGTACPLWKQILSEDCVISEISYYMTSTLAATIDFLESI